MLIAIPPGHPLYGCARAITHMAAYRAGERRPGRLAWEPIPGHPGGRMADLGHHLRWMAQGMGQGTATAALAAARRALQEAGAPARVVGLVIAIPTWDSLSEAERAEAVMLAMGTMAEAVLQAEAEAGVEALSMMLAE